MHARSGGNIEVMGLMQGKIQDDTMYVMDSFALPVEGTETRVNAQNEAYEYMVSYIEKSKEVLHFIHLKNSQTDINAIGWKIRKCAWLVSLSSWLRLLVIWY
jgi:COP9 signalosome complex subunit 5